MWMEFRTIPRPGGRPLRAAGRRQPASASISSSERLPGTMTIGIGNVEAALPAMVLNERAGPFLAGAGGEHQEGDVLVLLDELGDAGGLARRPGSPVRDRRRRRCGPPWRRPSRRFLASSWASAIIASPTPIHSKLSGGSTAASISMLAPVRLARRAAKCTARCAFGRLVHHDHEFRPVARLEGTPPPGAQLRALPLSASCGEAAPVVRAERCAVVTPGAADGFQKRHPLLGPMLSRPMLPGSGPSVKGQRRRTKPTMSLTASWSRER